MRRYHPLLMLFRLYNLVKSSFFIVIILFVFNRNSTFWLFEYGRYAVVVFIVWRILYIVTAWFVEKYEWRDGAFHFYRGVFVKQTSTIPFSRIQNVTRKTTIFHKVVGLTSVTFETAMDGEGDSTHFEVVSKEHAEFLITLVQQKKGRESVVEQDPVIAVELEESEAVESLEVEPREFPRTIHFTPQRKDLWKASFTSLSFLAIIPIGFAIFDYVRPFLPASEQVEEAYQVVWNQIWLLAIVILLALMIAIGFGVVRTFIRYGKYEISSDETHIYIHRGVIDESYFTIEKRKIQGLEMQQTFVKRLFGLAEVKLISSASPTSSDGSVNVNSLYPFLPVDKAFEMIKEILPSYQLQVELERLPRKSLWVKLLKPSWLWITATAALVYIKPEYFGFEQMWWIGSLALLCLVILHRVLDYVHTRYAMTEDQVQWWHGGLTSRMFITKRNKVIEMAYSQTLLQRRFNVASITTINRSTPVHTEVLHDVPLPYTSGVKDWYLERQKDIELMEN